MKLTHQSASRILIALALALAIYPAVAAAQTPDAKPTARQQEPETYQAFYLTHMTEMHQANDVQTALRNFLGARAKIFYVPSQHAMCLFATAEDMQTAQKMIADLDRPLKTYRVTYTITDIDGGKRAGSQHFSLVVTPEEKSILKQGNRVPIATGSTGEGATTLTTQFQYLDVGINIDASVSGEQLHSKIEQSSLADEKSGLGGQDPIVHQALLEGWSVLEPGKPFVLGSIDIPGTTRHQEVEVTSELVH